MAQSELVVTYKGYNISASNGIWSPKGGIYVMPVGSGLKYLQTDGTLHNNASGGWFDSVDHAKQVITPDEVIYIGGE